MQTMHAALGWATLAYLANGPDMILCQLVAALQQESHHPDAHSESHLESLDPSCPSSTSQSLNPWPVLSLLSHADPDVPDKLCTRIAQVLRSSQPALFNCSDTHTDVTKNLLATVNYWLNRLAQLPSTDESALADFLTLSGRFSLLTPSDPHWPTRVADLPQRVPVAAPLCLWVEGNKQLVDQTPSIGIVGSREMSSYGQHCARNAGRIAADNGAVVITGGAMGIDAQANQGALDSGQTPTMAIFAGGLDHVGPARNMQLFARICENGGALISELPPGTVPYASHFLERNRLIAALSDCVLVAQARYRSGALNTAHWAEQLGRSTLAIPGPIDSPSSAGCNRLLRSNQATILTDLDDLNTFLTPSLFPTSPSHVSHPSTPVHQRTDVKSPSTDMKDIVHHILQHHAYSRIDIADHIRHAQRRLHIPESSPHDITVALGVLEAQGAIVITEDGMIHSSGSHHCAADRETNRDSPAKQSEVTVQ